MLLSLVLFAQSPACCAATLRVRVPEGTGTVYAAGSLPALGNWRPDGVALTGQGTERTVTVTVPAGTTFEYKFTLGSWDREAIATNGAIPPNYRLRVDHDTVVTHEITAFKRDARDYLTDWKGSGVLGRLAYWPDVRSRFLASARHVEIWLPPGYDSATSQRYPVLYMHDGQNLFDPRLAFGGVDWGVDEAVVRLVQRGVIPPIIVVGVWNSSARTTEYSPWHRAPDYARFLIEELIPGVNAEFRTLTGPANTAVMGSSMGGLLSYYLVSHHPQVFGACGCISTHFPLSAAVLRSLNAASGTTRPDTTPYILKDIAAGFRVPKGTRYWFDYGTQGLDSAYAPTHAAVRAWLLKQKLVEGRDFVVQAYPGATHNEASWRARLEDPLTFLFAQNVPRQAVPEWSTNAIWYQIFVERFRNGDPSNDPTPHDLEGVTDEPPPPNWRPTPWTHDWYAQEPWAKATGKDFYTTVYFRRYGGDLQGVLDRLDYLQRLGVTALYLNPINDAPSLHKYDARNYHHVDRNFGPNPRGDEALIAKEDPVNPASWQWTAADSLFLKLVREVHRRGMRVIMDYSWNHTGVSFWAWRDILKNQASSRYAGWYEIERFDDPATRDTNEFKYRGWVGVPWLPELKKVGRPPGQTHGAIEGNLVPEVREHVFAVTRRWLDPNGDGNPSDGVDGFRLDVAEMVPLGFWRDYRQFVRRINPEAYLVGEVWWEQWPDRMYDPSPWLSGPVFDAVMNYRWYAVTRNFFAGAVPRLTASAYARQLDSLGSGVPIPKQRAMLNLTASHDTPRFGTDLFNPGRYKYHVNPREDSSYRIGRPDSTIRAAREQILVQLFTWVGAPEIWNGDEVGMWGADDPDERKPVVWSDLRYEDEATDPFGRPRRPDPVRPDTALFRTYQRLIALRRQHARLFAEGAVKWLVTDDAGGLLAYERSLGNQTAIVAFNVSDVSRPIAVDARGTYRTAWPARSGLALTASGGKLRSRLQPHSARIWIRP